MSAPFGVDKAQAFEYGKQGGVLQLGYHEQLWDDLDRLAMTAGLVGVSRKYVWETCRGRLDAEEIERGAKLNSLLREGQSGVLYTGTVSRVADRFMSLTGSFLRNYVNARFMTLAQALDEHRRTGTVEATILLIPDFHVPAVSDLGVKGVQKTSSGPSTSKAQWVTETIAGMLLERISTGRYTYLYSEDPERLDRDYGPYIRKLIEENYVVKTKGGDPVGSDL